MSHNEQIFQKTRRVVEHLDELAASAVRAGVPLASDRLTDAIKLAQATAGRKKDFVTFRNLFSRAFQLGCRSTSLEGVTRFAAARAKVESFYRSLDNRALEAVAFGPDRKPGLPKEALHRVEGRAAEVIRAAWPYRRSTTSWAGGRHYVTLRIVSPKRVNATCDRERVWSQNGKWPGIDGHAELLVTQRAVSAFGLDGLIIGGLITLDAEPIGPREYRATWAVQSSGMSLRVERGYIVRGYHVVSASIEKARRTVARKRSTAAAMIAAQRLKINSAQLISVQVTREDSLRGGNCAPGTDSFIASHNLDAQQGIKARELLELDDSVFTRRAVIAALARQRAEQQQMAQAA